jgi:uncharacterized protein YerC
LQRTRYRFLSDQCTIRDLYTLNRRIKGINRTDKLRFLLVYQNETKMSVKTRKLWNKIAELSRNAS